MNIRRQLASYTSTALNFLSKKIRRYVRISLPSNKTKPGIVKFYDRLNRKVIKFHVRDIRDRYTAKEIFEEESYNLTKLARKEEIVNRYRKILESNKTPLIIDCGGNIGLSACYFSYDFPEAQIICLEPEASNFQAAKKNTTGHEAIELLNGAIGSEIGFADISNPNVSNYRAFRVKETGNKHGIPIYTVNQLLSKYDMSFSTPFIIKIDIEGFEENLFSKNTEWISAFPLIIIELHDWMLPGSANSRNFLQAISRENRDFVYIGENIFSIDNAIL